MDLIAFYHAAIDRVVAVTGMSDKMAHVHAGLAIYLIAQLVFRTRRASKDALIAVVIAVGLNEVMDRLFCGSWRWADTLGDIAATLFWPTMLYALGRYRRQWRSVWVRPDAARPSRRRTTA